MSLRQARCRSRRALLLSCLTAVVAGSEFERVAPAEPSETLRGSIAFVSDRTGNPEIFVMRADGHEIRRLTRHSGNDGDPAWSPDGRSIAFVSDGPATPRSSESGRTGMVCAG